MITSNNIVLMILIAIAFGCHMVLHVLLKRLQVQMEQLSFFKSQLERKGTINRKKFRTWKTLFKKSVLLVIPKLLYSPIAWDLAKYQNNEDILNQANHVENTRYQALFAAGIYMVSVLAIIWYFIQ